MEHIDDLIADFVKEGEIDNDIIRSYFNICYGAGQKEAYARGRRDAVRYISKAKMQYISEKDVLTLNGEHLSTIVGSEKNYVSANDLDRVLNEAAQEEETLSS